MLLVPFRSIELGDQLLLRLWALLLVLHRRPEQLLLYAVLRCHPLVFGGVLH